MWARPELTCLNKGEMKELLKYLRGKFDLVTVRTVVKLHEQFGHPSREALTAALETTKKRSAVILGVRPASDVLRCPLC